MDPIGFGRAATRFLQNGGRLQIVTAGGIIAPEGGTIHILSVPVDESRVWKEVVEAGGPDTNTDWAIWEVGDQYPSTKGAALHLQKIILVNFGKFMRSEDILTWGKEQRLRPASPRACLAISEFCRWLSKGLGLNYMAVVSLVPCTFKGRRHVVHGWFERSERWANLSWFDDGWHEVYWFALVRE